MDSVLDFVVKYERSYLLRQRINRQPKQCRCPARPLPKEGKAQTVTPRACA